MVLKRLKSSASALKGVTARWWLFAFLGWLSFGSLRARMDDFGMSVQGDQLERTFAGGGLPTLWLQGHVYELAPNVAGYALAAIHVSWFIFPWVIAYHVTYWRRDLVPSFFATLMVVWGLALPAFALFPMEPPWMANADVTRVLAEVLHTDAGDPNKIAAMPSLHAAIPLAIAFWSARNGLGSLAAVAGTYSLMVATEVVVSGEHYVVDVIGAAILAVTAVWIVDVARRYRAPARSWASPTRPTSSWNSRRGPNPRRVRVHHAHAHLAHWRNHHDRARPAYTL